MTEQAAVAPVAGSRKRVRVTVIGRKGTNKIVQYKTADGYPRRVYIPQEEEKNGKVAVRVLDAGMPFGTEWERYIEEQTITPAEIAGSLRAKGIWTLEDLEDKHRQAKTAIGLVLNVNAAKLRRLVKTDEKK